MTNPVNEDDGGSNPLAERCQTCGQTKGWHEANPGTRHPFNSGQDGATDFLKRRGGRDPQRRGSDAQRGAETPQIVSPGNDPVLRIALINRGVLTPADLVVAEEQLRAALMEVQQYGESPAGARRGQVQEREAAPVDVGSPPKCGEEVGTQPRHEEE